jgi:hypothetical protein
MVQRLFEIKMSGQRDFRFWRWQLWLDGYLISVKQDCREALQPFEEVQNEVMSLSAQKGHDTLEVVEGLIPHIGTPQKGSLTEHIYRRIQNEADLHSLLVWLLHVGLGKKPLAGWHDVVDAENPLDLIWPPKDHSYPRLGELFAESIGAPKEWAKSAPWNEEISIGSMRQWIEEATEEEWEQVREDWRPIARLIPFAPVLENATKTAPIGAFINLYYDSCERALITSMMIQARRSNMEGDLDKVLVALGTVALALASAIESVSGSVPVHH